MPARANFIEALKLLQYNRSFDMSTLFPWEYLDVRCEGFKDFHLEFLNVYKKIPNEDLQINEKIFFGESADFFGFVENIQEEESREETSFRDQVRILLIVILNHSIIDQFKKFLIENNVDDICVSKRQDEEQLNLLKGRILLVRNFVESIEGNSELLEENIVGALEIFNNCFRTFFENFTETKLLDSTQIKKFIEMCQKEELAQLFKFIAEKALVLNDFLKRLSLDISSFRSQLLKKTKDSIIEAEENRMFVSNELQSVAKCHVGGQQRVTQSLNNRYQNARATLSLVKFDDYLVNDALKALLDAACYIIYVNSRTRKEKQSLVEALEMTVNYINGSQGITEEDYLNKAQEIMERSSVEHKGMGRAMIAFGVVFMLAGLLGVLAAVGVLFSAPVSIPAIVSFGIVGIVGIGFIGFGYKCFDRRMSSVSKSMKRFSYAKRDAKETGEILHTSFWRRKLEWPKIPKFQCPRFRRKLSPVPG